MFILPVALRIQSSAMTGDELPMVVRVTAYRARMRVHTRQRMRMRKKILAVKMKQEMYSYYNGADDLVRVAGSYCSRVGRAFRYRK